MISALGLGFVLGLRHALDLDHVVAVSAIMSENHGLARSSLIGAFWGVGHTASLLLIALLVIGMRWTISDRVALALEFGVALMLIGLGLNVLRRSLRLAIHSHGHGHGHAEAGDDHRHMHVHVAGSGHDHGHLFQHARRPLLVGLVHGLAGSAALMLLVLGTISSPWLGLAYVAIFGLGSIGGMLIMSSVIGLPFLWTQQRFARVHRSIRLGAGALSVAFGLFLAWQIGFVEGLLRL
jgi:ABC-type nickel/cobalt efflux system permease component RcnA